VTGQDDLLLRRVDLHVPPSPSAVCEALRAKKVRACCFEDADLGPRARPVEAMNLATVREAVDGIVTAYPEYRWEVALDDLLNVYPRGSAIEKKAPALHVAGKGLWVVLEEDLQLRDRGITLFTEFRDGDGPLISADLEDGTVRAALNACVAPLGGAVWHISGIRGHYFLSISAVA
jgi:hypothetical protein